MGDLIKRIVVAIKSIFSGSIAPDVSEALSPGTPLSRIEIESSLTAFTTLMQQQAIDKIQELETSHSPITPEESVKWASTFAGVGAAGLSLGAAGSIVAEAASLGQIETISRWLEKAWVQAGLAGMLGVPVVTLYDKAVRIPFNYYALSKFQPMIPGISDQIRFAVREAYPDVSVGMMDQEMKKWIRYLGYSEFWAKSYWNAHWIIPTLEQARNLWHKGVINQDEYMSFLRLSDYSPEYNDLWLALAHSLPGRIDQRWLYEWGFINRKDLVKFIQAEGIHPDWRDKLADSYIKNILRDEINRVRSQLITMFREGFMDEDRLRLELKDLGFIDDVINMSVQEAQIRREYDYKTDLLKLYMDQLKKFEIDEEQFVSNCRELGMTEDAIVLKLDITLAKQKKPKAE